jgi:hypothetical protein
MGAVKLQMYRRRRPVDKNDYYDINSKYYKDNFIQPPRDAITKRFKEVFKIEHYKEKLSPLILAGLPNLKERTVVHMKRKPLFSKLIEGKYEKDHANYDRKTTKVQIEFFVNNLPSFKKYADKDELDWVIMHHRLLSLELFEYYKDNVQGSVSTLETRFNGILRIIRIAYDTKKLPLYKLFSVIVFQLHGRVMDRDGQNILNRFEQKKFVNWLDVLKIQSVLQTKFDAIEDKKTTQAYDLNNDLLLLSLYCLIPPLRNEVKTLEFTRQIKNNKKDFIYVSQNKNVIMLKLNQIKKQHNKVYFNLTSGRFANQQLADIIKQSITLYPRQYLFTLKNAYPDISVKATQRALDERLISIFNRHGIKNTISVNSLRSSYVSYRLSQPISYNQKLMIVYQMRTSLVCLERSYNKILVDGPLLQDYCDECDECDDTQPARAAQPAQSARAARAAQAAATQTSPLNVQNEENDNVPKSNPETGELSHYQKKLLYNKQYYEKNKEELLKKQKQYKDKKTAFQKTRERTVQLLNSSSDYAKKIRPTTLEKYMIYFDDETSRWKWREE